MSQGSRLVLITAAIAFAGGLRLAPAQTVVTWNDPSFNGGVYVTPVPGVPFSGRVNQLITRVLGDGSSLQRKTMEIIARDSRGRIHNEIRTILPASNPHDPTLRVIHLYDPDTHADLLMNQMTRIAQQRVFSFPPYTAPPSNWAQQEPPNRRLPQSIREEDLGSDVIEGFSVHGYRRTITIPASASGIDRPVNVVDEYWYSDDLHLDLILTHDDPRSGSLSTKVTNLNVNEPAVEMFAIPPDFKVVDLTPPPPEEGPMNLHVAH